MCVRPKVASSPVNLPQLKYGSCAGEASAGATWSWLDISSPIFKCPEKVFPISVEIIETI